MSLADAEKLSTSAGYDARQGYLLSLISTWGYSDEKALKGVLARDHVMGRYPNEVKSFSMRNPALPVDAQAYLISYRGEFHVLCFRGTEFTQILDLLTDALIERHCWGGPDEWVHRGFFLSFDVLWPEIATELERLDGPLYITGHSLGGAMAVLAGRRLMDEQKEGWFKELSLRGVYTYGQPMVGNDTFRRACEQLPLFRHVYENDVVPRLPPTGMGTGDYVHFGELRESNGGKPKTWKNLGQSTDPKRCHASELVPSLLTLITARALKRNIPLHLFTAGLHTLLLNLLGFSLSIQDAKDAVAGIPRLIGGGQLSLDDHIPTHYVDVSKASKGKGKESELAA